MKIVSVVGTRPQFVKAAVVSHILRRRHTEILVHTGQHYDEAMSAAFFRDLHLPAPDHHLGVGSGPHGRQTGQMLARLETVLQHESPNWVLVYGDTNSTVAAALAAAKLNIPVAHVEAGCRSYDRRMPEEINRVVTDHVSTLLLCATERAIQNLHREGISAGIHHVGDVMLDLVCDRLPEAETRLDVLERLRVEPHRYILATLHRAGNTDDPVRLASICEGLSSLKETVVFPLHPRTRRAMEVNDLSLGPVRVIDPVGYVEMLTLTRHARLVITDSGGVQKEAFFVGTPCVTVRDTTEWPETVEAGWNRLVGAEPEAIRHACDDWAPPPIRPTQLFGSGAAAERIVESLAAHAALTQ